MSMYVAASLPGRYHDQQLQALGDERSAVQPEHFHEQKNYYAHHENFRAASGPIAAKLAGY